MAFTNGSSTLYNPYPQPYHHHQHSYQPQHQPTSTHNNLHYPLNPSVSSFQPNGTEMQRYQPSQTPTSSPYDPTALPSDMAQMQRYVLTNHFDHTKDIAVLERKIRQLCSELSNTQNVFRRDLQTLQGQVQTRQLPQEADGAVNQVSRAEQVVPPPAGFLEEFSREKIAEVYLDEAEDYELAAQRLKEQAEQICADVVSERAKEQKAIEGEALDRAGSNGKNAEFACCGEVFDAVDCMLGHMQKTHGFFHEEVNGHPVVVNGNTKERDNDLDTPTHVPPRRSKPKKDEEQTNFTKVEQGHEQMKEAETALSQPQPNDKDTSKTITGVPKEESSPLPSEEMYIPLAVRNMPPPPTPDTTSHTETFTQDFLTLNFGGHQYSPGFFFIPHRSDLPSCSYWLLDSENEPHLPSSPGQHGAKLTAFFNESPPAKGEKLPDEANYLRVPVFIPVAGEKEYRYFGNYSQTRYSDKLDYERVITAVPENVRRYWAKQLTAQDRPEWVTEALIAHFWPKPQYFGPYPTDSAVATPVSVEGDSEEETAVEKRVSKALAQYAQELKDWRKEAVMKVKYLTEENLMKAFGKADADEEAGLRLWWEYLECVGYDEGFYEFLVTLKRNPGLQRAVGAVVKKGGNGGSGVRPDVGGKIVKHGPTGVETMKPVAATAKPSEPKIWAQTSSSKGASKLHTGDTKPWEQKQADQTKDEKKPIDTWLAVDDAKPAEDTDIKKDDHETSKTPNGDLELAKSMQQSFSKAKPSKPHRGSGGNKNGGGGANGNASGRKGDAHVAPHLRGKAAKS